MRWVTHDIVPIRCFEHAENCNFNYLDGKRRRMANKLAFRLAVVKLRWGFSCHICIKNGKEKDVPQLSKMCNIRLTCRFSLKALYDSYSSVDYVGAMPFLSFQILLSAKSGEMTLLIFNSQVKHENLHNNN